MSEKKQVNEGRAAPGALVIAVVVVLVILFLIWKINLQPAIARLRAGAMATTSTPAMRAEAPPAPVAPRMARSANVESNSHKPGDVIAVIDRWLMPPTKDGNRPELVAVVELVLVSQNQDGSWIDHERIVHTSSTTVEVTCESTDRDGDHKRHIIYLVKVTAPLQGSQTHRVLELTPLPRDIQGVVEALDVVCVTDLKDHLAGR